MRPETLFLLGALTGLTVSLWVLWPFMDAIAWAVFTAYFLRHVEERLYSYTGNKKVSMLLTLILLFAIVGGLLYFVVAAIPVAAIVSQEFFTAITSGFDVFAEQFDLDPEVVAALNTVVMDMIGQVEGYAHDMIFHAPTAFIHLGMYFIITIYLVKDGKRISNAIFNVIDRFPDEYQAPAKAVSYSIDHLFRGVFTTYLIVDMIVGILAITGFYFLGVEHYWVWGVLAGLFAFLPIISAAMIYLPLSAAYFLDGNMLVAAGILIYGITVLNLFTEIVLRPHFGAYQTQENPFLLFLGFLLGPLALGLKGVIIGPILLVVTKNLYTMQYFKPPRTDSTSGKNIETVAVTEPDNTD